MSTGSPLPPQRLPTLTEVVAWPESLTTPPPARSVQPPLAEADVMLPLEPLAGLVPSPVTGLTQAAEDLIVQRVLDDLQRQVDLMLEYRLREMLTPLLARAADSIVRDARQELASTLREVVARAVTQELLRHRAR